MPQTHPPGLVLLLTAVTQVVKAKLHTTPDGIAEDIFSVTDAKGKQLSEQAGKDLAERLRRASHKQRLAHSRRCQ